MSKRTWAVLAAGALFASVLAIGPASAQAKPFACGQLFTDPAGDVDFANLDVTGGGIAATDDASFTVEMQVANLSTDVPADATGVVWYFLWKHADVTYYANATAGIYSSEVTYGLGTLDGTSFSAIGPTEGTFTEGENGTITILVPYEAVGNPTPGTIITEPYADTRARLSGPAGPGLVSPVDRGPDGTAFGEAFTAGTCEGDRDAPAPDPGPPSDGEVGKDDPNSGGPTTPPVKKGCKKGKGKKKGCKKPKAAACAPYTPGEQGAEAPLALLTKDHTEEAPLEIVVEQGPGVPEASASHVFQNLQVDAAGAEGGVYIRYEFPAYEDHDLYVNYADGSEAAHVGGFNPAPVPVALGCCDGTGTGGHSEQGAEQIDGLRTADCAGYTLDLVNFAGVGGEYTVKVWLGEVLNDPAPPGGGR